MSTEAVQFALSQVKRDDTAAGALLHDEIDREIFDEEGRAVANRLLIQRVQHRMPGAIGGRAGALCDALAEVRGHAAERALIDAAVLRCARTARRNAQAR